jgi:ferritin-like metal-binding protein YciE
MNQQPSSRVELLHHQLNKLYSVEVQLSDTLPEFMQQARSDMLREGIRQHIDTTRSQRDRMYAILTNHNVDTDAPDEDRVMKTLLDDTKSLCRTIDDAEVRDIAILSGATKIEHYEMAGYLSAMNLAREIGEDDTADLLQEIYNEEQSAARQMEGLGGSKGIVERVKEAITG